MPTPVPAYPSGYRLGSGDAPLQIEAFIDLECPFSKKAWPTLLGLVNQEPSDRLAITAQLTVLADHRQSWDLTKAVTAVADPDPLQGWKLISHLYQNQDRYSSTACEAKTHQDVLALVATLIQEFDAALPTHELVKDIGDESSAIASRAKTSIRYAISRGVWSTPTVFINGSEVPQLESSSTLSDWRAFLAEL